MFKTYDETCEVLNRQYNEKNYKIVYHNVSNNRCYIYFSGNGLYVDNNEESFYSRITISDRYEWQKFSVKKKPAKEIFIRDIWLSWYVKGINTELNSIDKVIEWLKKECLGYLNTFIGNSAGGYMAVICGCSIPNTERIFCISGQVSLYNHNDHYKINPLLKKYGNEKWLECYHLLEMKNSPKVFYLYPAGVDHDVVQRDFLRRGNNVDFFAFDSSIHGVTANKFDFPMIFSKSNLELEELASKCKGKILSADSFSILLTGRLIFYKNKLLKYFYYKKCRLQDKINCLSGRKGRNV